MEYMVVSVLSRQKRLLFIMCVICLIASGCSSLLPSTKATVKANQWNSFDEAKALFEKITPYSTTTVELAQLGIDAGKTPNLTILTYLDIILRFMANPSITKKDLDVGMQDCISVKIHCNAYELKLKNILSARHGSVFLDLMNMKRSTQVSGWEFEALIVMVQNKVVYKLWKGRPSIDEETVVRTPLGPLQESAGFITDTTKSILGF